MAKLVADFDYTDAELLALFRQALAHISIGGQNYQIGDRIFEAGDLPEIRTTITWLEQRVNADAATGPAELVARMVRR